MKSKDILLAIHRSYDKVTEFRGEPVFHVATIKGVKKISGTEATFAFVEGLKKGTTVRLTSINGFEGTIFALQQAGIRVVTAHWHKTEIIKGQEPEQIAAQFLALPVELFTDVKIRMDLFELKAQANTRENTLRLRIKMGNQLLQTRRALGLGDTDKLPKEHWLAQEQATQDRILEEAESNVHDLLWEAAKKVPEYLVMKDIMGVKRAECSYPAAQAVAYIGDPSRFANVAKLWKYAGLDVVNGEAAGREGRNGKLKTVMLGRFIPSTTKNGKWKQAYEEYTKAELTVHAAKCAKCTTEKRAEIHSKRRAARRVAKEVLAQYWAATHSAPELKAMAAGAQS